MEGLKNELRLKTNECNELHEELKRRPIIVEKYCDLVSYKNHKEDEIELSKTLREDKEVYVCARKGNGVLVLKPISYSEEDGMFMGLVVHTENTIEVNVLEIVYFGAYDLYPKRSREHDEFIVKNN